MPLLCTTAHGHAIVAAVVSNRAHGGKPRCSEKFSDFRPLIPTVLDQKPSALSQVRHGMSGDFSQAGKAVSAVGEGGLRFILKSGQMFVVASDVGRVADDDIEGLLFSDGFPPGTLTKFDFGAERGCISRGNLECFG